jgi:hypothetical protein
VGGEVLLTPHILEILALSIDERRETIVFGNVCPLLLFAGINAERQQRCRKQNVGKVEHDGNENSKKRKRYRCFM